MHPTASTLIHTLQKIPYHKHDACSFQTLASTKIFLEFSKHNCLTFKCKPKFQTLSSNAFYFSLSFKQNFTIRRAAICKLLFLKCLKVMGCRVSTPSSTFLSLSCIKWQIIWLFIMNCHVSQGNYINYPDGRFWCYVVTILLWLHHVSASFFCPRREIIKQQMTKYYSPKLPQTKRPRQSPQPESKDFYWKNK